MNKKKKDNSIEEDILKTNKNKVKEDDVKIDVTQKSKIKGFFSKNFNKKFKDLKIKYKKDPKKFVVATLGILLAFSALVGSSYAYLTYVSKTDNTTVISAGTLALTFNNESNAITLEGALPITDEEGLEGTTEYTFDIKNTGSIPATYKITLDSTCNTGNTYTVNNESIKPDLCIPNEYIKVGLKQGNGSYKVLEKKKTDDSYILDADSLGANKSKTYTMKIWLDYNTPNDYNSSGNKNVIYVGKLGLSYEQGTGGNLDTSGANKPVLDSAMIPVYYDESTETWKKADETNTNKKYKWYDYDSKMWANSVTVSSTNRNTYQKAELGTEIPMDDILTMQVWIPRYKYKVWNYNADGQQKSDPQQIEITFEEETSKTGEITCTDSISGTHGDPSETCKLKATNATCTDSTCNNKTYTHPAFTFGNEELTGFWIGKFELTGTISNITVKPNLISLREPTVSSLETNIMNLKNSGNQYGLSTSTDTHMIKNSEWGAVSYLSHSKYGTCTDGNCKEVKPNNSLNYYTGRSGGNSSSEESAEGTYKYNQTQIPSTVMTGGTTITPTVTNNTSHPWDVSSNLEQASFGPTSVSGSYNLEFDFTAPTDNTYLSFDWTSFGMRGINYGYLYYTITKDGETLSDTGTSTKLGGKSQGVVENDLLYEKVLRKLDKGTYKLTFTIYNTRVSAGGGGGGSSSGSTSTFTSTISGYIKNMKILDSPTLKEGNSIIGTGYDGPSASTTHNVYGVYDMNGGSYEYTMSNMVSNDGTTMMSGPTSSQNSGYTGKIYDNGNFTSYTGIEYPGAKYYDKYSYSTSYTSRKRSKLGDGIKEVYTGSNGWYSDTFFLPYYSNPWFGRGGHCSEGSKSGLFSSIYHSGDSSISSNFSSHLIITP